MIRTTIIGVLAAGALLSTTAGAAVCPGAPPVCRTAQYSALKVTNKPNGAHDLLAWKWWRGQTNTAEYNNPFTSTTFAVCLYAGTAAALLGEMDVQPSSSAWSPYGGSVTYGYRYDGSGGNSGIQKMQLKGGAGNAKITVKARGGVPTLGLPLAPPALPLIIQLHKSNGPECWESRFPTASVNSATKFKATSP